MNKIKSLIEKIKIFFIGLFEKCKPYLIKVWNIIANFAKKHKILTTIIFIFLALVLFITFSTMSMKKKMEENNLVIVAEKRDIEEAISDSTVIEPNDEYSITSMVTGDILDAPFDEGDHIIKGDLLYTIDATTLENSIQSADIAIARAKKAYESAELEDQKTIRDYTTGQSTLASAQIAVQKAEQSYNDALRAKNDLSLKSNHSGTVTTLYVSAGDTIAAGTKIADVRESDTMKVKIPFNSQDANNIFPGELAKLTLTRSGSKINGVVTEVSTLAESGPGYTSYKKVTIEVKNPGAISSDDSATAMIGEIACSDVGKFESITEDSITATASGKIDRIYISEYNRVTNGQIIISLNSDTIDSQVRTSELTLSDAKQALERATVQSGQSSLTTDIKDNSLVTGVSNAKLAYDDALLAKEKLLKQLDDYTIEAPISGTVITKNKKKGDKLGSGSSATSSYSASSNSLTAGSAGASSSSSSALAVIYDMSRLKCTLNVDELDVKNVRIGQKVTITADASDKEYTGAVENINVEGTVGTNGVTTYPVKIEIIDFDASLLPGMNIEANIVVTSVHDIISIPTGSVNRGNLVYIKGEKTENDDKAPEGYKTVKVETGANDGEYIQIISGIEEGEEIYSSAQSMTPEERMMQMQQNNMNSSGNGGGM